MALSILSFGRLMSRAACTAALNRMFVLRSGPPVRAATSMSRACLLKILPRLASIAAFLCLMVCHFE